MDDPDDKPDENRDERFDRVFDDSFVREAEIKEADARSRARAGRAAEKQATRARRSASRRRLRQRLSNRTALTIGVLAVLIGTWMWQQRLGPFSPSSRTVEVTLPSTTVPLAGIPATPDRYELDGRSFHVGECVIWDDSIAGPPEPRATTIVGCDSPHILEVTDNVTIMARSSDYPTDAGWAEIYAQSCTAPTVRVLGQPLDPDGRFFIGGVQPTPAGWASGQRSIVCGVQARSRAPLDSSHEYLRFTGRVAGQNQTLLYGTGTCLSSGPDGTLAVTPCAAPHDREVTGTVDLTGRADALPAGTDVWVRLIGRDCEKLSGGRPWGWLSITPGSWDAGRRVAECLAITG